MNDPGRFADELLNRLLSAELGQPSLPGLGRMLLQRICGCLKAEGLAESEHGQQVFARMLERARNSLAQAGAVRTESLVEWFRALADHTLRDYLRERVEVDTSWVVSLLEGSEALGGGPSSHARRALGIVRSAISCLPEPYRRFVHLDIVELVPIEEIGERMGFASREEALRFKKAAFEALQREVRTQLTGAKKALRFPVRDR